MTTSANNALQGALGSEKLPALPTGRFWLQWVAANAAGEALGLGATTAVGVGIAGTLGTSSQPSSVLLAASLMIGAGTLLEGVVVGIAQWLVLRRVLPQISLRLWVGMTALGACIAWTLGMIPSTIMNLRHPDPAAAPIISDMVVYTLAAVMGLVLGPILAIPQWVALRRYLRGAGGWIPANAVAWAFGMVVIFVGMGSIDATLPVWQRILRGLITLAAAGAVVGMVHGLFLMRMLRRGVLTSSRDNAVPRMKHRSLAQPRQS